MYETPAIHIDRAARGFTPSILATSYYEQWPPIEAFPATTPVYTMVFGCVRKTSPENLDLLVLTLSISPVSPFLDSREIDVKKEEL